MDINELHQNFSWTLILKRLLIVSKRFYFQHPFTTMLDTETKSSIQLWARTRSVCRTWRNIADQHLDFKGCRAAFTAYMHHPASLPFLLSKVDILPIEVLLNHMPFNETSFLILLSDPRCSWGDHLVNFIISTYQEIPLSIVRKLKDREEKIIAKVICDLLKPNRETLFASFLSNYTSILNFSTDDSLALRCAVKHPRHHHHLPSLLRYTDPTARDHCIIIKMALKGDDEGLKILLDDGRADPAAQDHKVFRKMTRNLPRTVELLLKDGRADPSVKDNCLLKRAVARNWTEVAELLLKDRRVDPALCSAKLLFRNASNCPQMVLILLKDGRVSPLGATLDVVNIYKRLPRDMWVRSAEELLRDGRDKMEGVQELVETLPLDDEMRRLMEGEGFSKV